MRNILVAFVIALASSVSYAGVNEQMNEWMSHFNDPNKGLMGNVTPAGAYQNASMGIFSGGALSIRSQIKNVTPWHVSPPNIASGCGGIDVYGGYFSLISKEEFINQLRAIGQNAVGYAFKLAMTGLCPTCMEIIDNLAARINEAAQMLANSCETAQFIVDNGWKGVKSSVEKQYGEISDAAGATSGILDSKNWFVGGKSSAENAQSADPVTKKEQVAGNVVWRALKKSDFTAAYTFGDNEFARFALSLTGTVVVKDTPTQKEGVPVGDSITWSPTLSVTELFSGGSANGNDINIRDCSDGMGVDECLNDSVQPLGLKGLQERIRDLMIGPSPGNTGLVQKWATGTGMPTNDEMAFTALAGVAAPFLAEISLKSQALGRSFAHEVAGDLAIVFIDRFVYALQSQVKTSIADMNHAGAAKMVDELNRLNDVWAAEIAKLRQQYPGTESEIIRKGKHFMELASKDNTVNDGPVTSTSN